MEIGFIGLGSMGAPMARRLMVAGHALTVHDVSPAAVRPFASAGARVAAAPAGCAGSEIAIVMVADDSQVETVVLGAGGLLDGVSGGPPPLVVVMSTVLPQTILTLSEALKARGARVVDAPVSGGIAGAEAGTLAIMTGGAAADLDVLEPVLAVLGAKIFACGALGSGATVKILNNLVGVTALFLTAEAAALGRQFGVAPERLAEIMDASSGRSAFSQDWPQRHGVFARISGEPARMRSQLAICRKDLALAARLAGAVGLDLPVAADVARSLRDASDDVVTARWREAFGGTKSDA